MAGTAVVVLTVDAAAGRGLLIYLCSTADRLEEAAFRIFFQPFSIAQTAPFMGQPFPTRTPEMQHRFKSVLHFRLPSAPQRYNTLDFPTENRVPRWTLSPLDTPAKGNAVSLWIPPAFSATVSTQTAKMQFGYHFLKMKNRCNSYPVRG